MKTLAIALALLGLSALACADDTGPRALRLRAADAPVRIDGLLDDPAWARAPVYERFVQFLPEDKQPARWRTTVQVLADEHALIFGIRAYDDAPEQIRAPLTRRDQVRRDQDFVSVVLDPVGQRRAAQFIRISASGGIADGMFTAEDDAEDFAPDFDVQVATHRLPDGYSVELRWPLAALRYPYADGAPWRVMVTRSIPREDSVLLVSAPLTKDALSFIAELQPLLGLDELVDEVRERSFLTLRPEVTARATRSRGPEGSQRERLLNVGGELKWRPRADWVIDATLNPDFSQVELDTPQLAGNTRFALFVPEKRPFFLESSDVVGQTVPDDSGQARGLAAFYSRAVTDPDWGLRATWRGAAAEATLLSLRDAGGGQVLRSHAYGTDFHAQDLRSQASFARGRVQAGAWGVAALASLRDYGEGRSNRVLGSDFAWRVGEEDLARGHVLLSSTTAGFDAQGQLQRQAAQQGHYAWLSWRHRDAAWGHTVDLERLSPRFANDNGFVSQTGVERVSLHLHRRLGTQDLAPLGEWSRFQAYEFEWQAKLVETRTLADASYGVRGGERLEQRVQPGLWFSSARNFELWAHVGLDRQRAQTGGQLHAPRTLLIGAQANPWPWLGLISAELEWGRRLDVEADRLGSGVSLTLEAKMKFPLGPGWWLELDPHLAHAYVKAPGGQGGVRELAWQNLAVLHLSARDSVRAVLQRSALRREAEAGLPAHDERGRLVSLMVQHRQGLSRVFSLGWTQSRPDRQQRTTELFAKLAADLEL